MSDIADRTCRLQRANSLHLSNSNSHSQIQSDHRTSLHQSQKESREVNQGMLEYKRIDSSSNAEKAYQALNFPKQEKEQRSIITVEGMKLSSDTSKRLTGLDMHHCHVEFKKKALKTLECKKKSSQDNTTDASEEPLNNPQAPINGRSPAPNLPSFRQITSQIVVDPEIYPELKKIHQLLKKNVMNAEVEVKTEAEGKDKLRLISQELALVKQQMEKRKQRDLQAIKILQRFYIDEQCVFTNIATGK